MRASIRKCCDCGRYTLKIKCPVCGGRTIMSIPPKFSPEDPYGKYRRKLRREIGFFIRRCVNVEES